jgi:hypothetical protein
MQCDTVSRRKREAHMTRLISTVAMLIAGMSIMGGFARAETQAESRTVRQWNEELRHIEEQLQQSQWESARHLAQMLLEDLVERSGGTLGDKRDHADELGGAMAGPVPLTEAVVLGRTAAFRAIAEAALERRDEARWHWYLAQNLLGDVRSVELERYKVPAKVLQRHYLIDGRGQYSGMPDILDPVRPDKTRAGDLREPVRTHVVYPYLPRDLRGRDRFSHVVFVNITVDVTGQIVHPVVVDGGFYPGLTSRAFDALREWRYRPAALNDMPVPFRFVVPVAFADDRAVLPLAEWGTPAPSLGIVPTGHTLNRVAGLSADLQSGTVYVVDSADSRILRITSREGSSSFAGIGTPGFNGNDVAALEAQLDHPSAVSYDPRTSELFVADTRNYRIRSISPKGFRLRTVAGIGLLGVAAQNIPFDMDTPEAVAIGHYSGDGRLAAEAELNLPMGVCADPVGILFIADSGNHRIRAVNRGTSPVILMGIEIEPGHIQTIAGTGVAGFSGDGGKAAQAQFAFPTKLKIDASGNLLVVDSFNQRVRRIDRQSGIIRTIVKGGLADVGGEQNATSWSASLAGFAILPNQDIVYADRSTRTIHRLTRAGDDTVIFTAAAREGAFTDVEVGAQGEVYIAENQRIGVLHLEGTSSLIYLAGAKSP